VSVFLTFQEIGTQAAYHRLDILQSCVDCRVVLIEREELSGKPSIVFQKAEMLNDAVGDDFDFDELKWLGQVVERSESNRFDRGLY
jgi:hypothetical protein